MKERRALLLTAVFVVNFLSLVYQIVWTRKIGLIFGTTALSISTILTVFLSGIALGGYLGGRFIRNVERRYFYAGAALVALGLYCMASLYLFGFIRYPFLHFAEGNAAPIYINLVKFAFSFVILIFPTTLIGATFPVVTHLYSNEFSRLGGDVASIYSLDTLGASLGAAAAGFVFVPVLGLSATSIASAALFILIGAAIMSMEKRGGRGGAKETPVKAERPARPGLDGVRILVLAALFVSGFSALVLEVVWSRYFHLLFGTSIYAFALVVAAFLAGLSAGSFLIRKRLDRIRNPLLVFAYLEIVIAGVSLAVLQTSPQLEAFYMKLFYATDNFYLFQSALFGAAFVAMLIPAALMGANFPLAIRIFGRSGETRGEDTGLVFSVNTAGGIIGAFAAGFFIIPRLGLEDTSILASALYFIVGAAFLAAALAGGRTEGPAVRRLAHPAAAALLGAFILLFAHQTYGEPDLGISVYYNGVRKKSYEDYARIKKMANIVYARQGLYGLVAVERDRYLGRVALWTNGKVDASNARNDMQNQQFLAHLPLLFHRSPEKVLNIGFGSGVTAGAATSHLDVTQIDCVELDPLVVEAAERFFADYNNRPLADPRVRVHYEDGRHFLDTTTETYDVIISEPSNIWISGVSQLFTGEFYRIADRQMNEGAIFAQWVPAYDLAETDFKLILRTIKERFEHVVFWSNGVDIIILASHTPMEPDSGYIEEHANDPVVVTELRKAMPEPDFSSLMALLERIKSTEKKIPGYIEDFQLVNTDNLNYLEFSTVKNAYNVAHRPSGGF